MVRRDRHDIAMDILKTAKSAKNKTELMKEVNMSFVQAKQYLDVLLKNELVEMPDSHHYKTTKKGLDYIKKCGECFLFNWHTQKGSKFGPK